MPREPYPYQRRVLHTLLEEQRPVLLQAPTGAGKTLAALWPFLHAFRHDVQRPFPAQAIYSVPMRVLANQFFAEYRALTQALQLREQLRVTIQTGETPLDPEFHGDLVFATLDQTLSSLLGVPYSLSPGRANLNVGAVLGAYLIFDEFHLFPYQATRTLFHLLQHLRPVVPFVLMTATFSRLMLEALGEVLDAHVEVVPPAEAQAIVTRGGRPARQRRFFTQAGPLVEPTAARSLLENHRRRTLAVLNTVARAQHLYRMLVEAGARPVPWSHWVTEDDWHRLAEARDLDTAVQPLVARVTERLLDSRGPWVMLLHSRFLRAHRLAKEALLRHLWGPEGLQGEQPSLIVVATQVVEVGLDISAEVLHTELAPAAAVLQRAGRCARYPGEQGEVFVYPVPPDQRGQPNYAPYGQSRIERETAEASWQALQARHGTAVDFPQEQAIIDEAHAAQDRALLDELREGAATVWSAIAASVLEGERGARTELIRDALANRTVLVYDAPTETDQAPFGLEGFSLHVGTLAQALPALHELATALGLEWAVRTLQVRQGPTDSDPPAYLWLDASTAADLAAAFLLAVHPRLAAYDPEVGFRLAEPSDGHFRSPYRRRPRPQPPDYGAYRLECYHQHIAGMRRVFEQGPWKRRFAWPAARLAARLGVPEEQLWRALYLALALHDVGKLQQPWQAWAWAYQRRIGQPLPEDHCLVAHTCYDDSNEAHRRAARASRRQHKKPNHAGEGADAALPVVVAAFGGRTAPRALVKAVTAAILRHHNAQAYQARPYRLHPRAPQAVAQALAVFDLPAEGARRLRLEADAPTPDDHLPYPEPGPQDPEWWAVWLYFLLVRVLRLTDGLSQQEQIA